MRTALPEATLLRPVPLGVYAALAQRAAVVIANDSGSSHVAAAVGARQVTIFGVTDRQRTGPWSKRAICVGDNGAFNSSGALALANIEGHVGYVDVTMDLAAAIGARGVGAPATGSGITCEAAGASGHETSLWVLIEARATYIPANGETFYITVEGARS